MHSNVVSQWGKRAQPRGLTGPAVSDAAVIFVQLVVRSRHWQSPSHPVPPVSSLGFQVGGSIHLRVVVLVPNSPPSELFTRRDQCWAGWRLVSTAPPSNPLGRGMGKATPPQALLPTTWLGSPSVMAISEVTCWWGSVGEGEYM